MQIVIDIPEKWLKDMKQEEFCKVDALCQKILNGTPLPKHHGDLKDVSKLDVLSWQGKSDEFTEGVTWAMEQLDSLPTAIPAAKEGENK